ncbi:chromodomain-helicase-DNA-binding protein 8 isoform X1 [Tachysurus ichikawai]
MLRTKIFGMLVLTINILFFQGFLPEHFFHRLLTLHTTVSRQNHNYLTNPSDQLDPQLEEGENEMLVSDGAYIMDDEDLDSSSLTTSHHLLTSTFDAKLETSSLDIDKGDALSTIGYDSSDREAILDDVIMAPKNSDSSSCSED